MALQNFHPAVAAWFGRCFDAPTAPQARAWPSIRARQHTLIAAPTGSGKTLAAFLSAIDELVRQAERDALPERTQVVYVSPLKALSNDIRKNLRLPLEGIAAELGARAGAMPDIRVQVRSGDTPPAERQRMVAKPPHILVTTPESLYILLTSDGGRRMLGDVRTLIVDEIHAVASDKRGSHLALTVERLEALVREEHPDRTLQRIGLSATQKPIEDVARYLVGSGHLDPQGRPDCIVVDTVGSRPIDLDIEMPDSPLEALMAGEVWDEVYDRLAELIREHRTTLLFVNTRRLAERLAHNLASRLGDDAVTSHHGSLSKEARLDAEARLKSGALRALVATASLELGIDIGAIDLVVQLGSPRSINTLMQRVGRASHHVGGVPKGRIFPVSRDDLVESVAAVAAARRGELDRLIMPDKPIDILAQQIVACAASRDWHEDELFELCRRAYPFRALTRQEFDTTVDMLAEGFSTRRGTRGRYLHLDAVNGRIKGRRGARLTAITCGGAIPDNFEFRVLQEPEGLQVGTLDEDFSIESLPGDIFQLGNSSWRILRVETGVVRVEDARGLPPTIPFWFGEAPGRTRELSETVSQLRDEIDARIAPDNATPTPATISATAGWLAAELAINAVAATETVEYLAAARVSLGAMPTRETIVMERFFDEAGDMHLVIHSPFGTRVNRAWGLALRKVFCRTFNFELQAAATDDALVLSLGPTHSFPLEEVFGYLNPTTVRDKLVQAFLDAPMFPVRWRWNATRSLAVKRWVSGRRLAPHLQRMDAEDLLAVIFPDSLACFENIEGARQVPDHPLVEQTIDDCLEEAMDFDEFIEVLEAVVNGDKKLLARDLREPSPLAYEILSARPYAFLDDAPAEERRTLAVQTRRRVDPESADDLGALDQAAIDKVQEEAWPAAIDPDELHDALLLHGFLTPAELAGARPDGGSIGWTTLYAELEAAGRAAQVTVGTARLIVAAERLPQFEALAGLLGTSLGVEPALAVPERARRREWTGDEALREIVRGRLQALGPVVVSAVATSLGVTNHHVDGALLALEAEGFAFRGRFTPGGSEVEWCERRLLSRVHRYTLHRLRAEIEPVTAADFMRFQFDWQRVTPAARARGPESLAAIVGGLEGFEAAAGAWESEILPARLADYDPVWLDALCLSGRVTWCRRTSPTGGPRGSRSGPIRSTPIALLTRERLDIWARLGEAANPAEIGHAAATVQEALLAGGASFFADLGRSTGLLDSQLEEALGELAGRGLVTADSFTGLRALLVPSSRRRPRAEGRRKGRTAIFGMENAGRWSLLHAPGSTEPNEIGSDECEQIARLLLRRYGVVFRRLLRREANLPPWRDLMRVFYRLEARGEVRGGRFVAGFQGQQFALAEAVTRLREVRRTPGADELVSVSAADPLNLAGIVTPGDLVTAVADNRVLFADGVVVATREAGQVHHANDADAETRWRHETALVRRELPPKLRPYLGRSA
jgi:ATP-dependent Lhr-like helicase